MQFSGNHAGGQKANNTKALFLLYIDAVSIVARRSSAMRTAKRSDNRFKCARCQPHDFLPLNQNLPLHLPLHVLIRVLTLSLSICRAEEPDTEQMDESVPPNVTSFSNRDLQFIVKFHSDFAGHQFRHLVHALCPSIYGHELEKVCISQSPVHKENILRPNMQHVCNAARICNCWQWPKVQ